MQAVTLSTTLVILLFSAQAQYRAPQAERKTPRATAVLETFQNGSQRLLPVTFFYGRHYYRELDLYPELRLVDAVDPDGYGRYALLFREQKRDGASWLLGRMTGYELQPLFETAVR
jgi:hypothetical protein